MTVMFVEAKNCRTTRNVSQTVVMMQRPVVVLPLVWIFALDVFPQSPQNVTVEFFLNCLS